MKTGAPGTEELVFEVMENPPASKDCQIAFKYEQSWLLKEDWHLNPDSTINLTILGSKKHHSFYKI